MRLASLVAVLVTAGLLASCEQTLQTRFFTEQNAPAQLSDWNVLRHDSTRLRIADDAMVYDLNTALFSDYAAKLRTLHIPAGETISHRDGELHFPVGTVVSKTFLYQVDDSARAELHAHWSGDPSELVMRKTRLMETRLLVHTKTGWQPFSYVWRDGNAYHTLTGDLLEVDTSDIPDRFAYLVPSRNQCASCHATNHTTGKLKPIGLQVRHLNKPDPVFNTNQLQSMVERGWLKLENRFADLPANAVIGDTNSDLEHRARSYLDINCGHCHNPEGAADTSGLLLHYGAQDLASMGRCKPPIAAGRGSGGHLYSIVPGSARHSIMSYRMATRDPGSMMPELGRTLVHLDGVELIDSWINTLQGECR